VGVVVRHPPALALRPGEWISLGEIGMEAVDDLFLVGEEVVEAGLGEVDAAL
jgi:hypothetical protein